MNTAAEAADEATQMTGGDVPEARGEHSVPAGQHTTDLQEADVTQAVARAYGAYRASEGVSERALFVIDKDGVIRWSYVSPVGVNPGADGILTALEALPSQVAR